MPRSDMYHSKAKTDYPNRFLSDAQVCPVSSGHTLASVRSGDTYMDDMHTLRAMTGFKPEWYSDARQAGLSTHLYFIITCSIVNCVPSSLSEMYFLYIS